MSIRRALLFSYLEKYGTFVIGLVSTMVISRVLTPAEVGVFSVAMSVVGIVAVIREFGVSTYIVQEGSLTEERVRAAFTLTVAIGIALAALLLALSIPAGAFYDDSSIATVMIVLAVGFAITPFGSVSQALLARDLEFGVLSVIRLTHATVMALVGIGLALAGFGPISLAWASAAAALASAVLSTMARPHSHRPSYSKGDLRRVFRIGGPATGAAILDDIAGSLPDLVLARTQSLGDVGLFSRGRSLSQLAQQVVVRAASPVLFSAFASGSRGNASVADIYIRATQCLTAIGWAALGSIALLADPVVRVLFGAQWVGVVPIVRWLCLAAAASLLVASSTNLLLAGGNARAVFGSRIAWFPLHAVVVTVGALISLEAVAIGLVMSSLLNCLIQLAVVRRYAGIGLERHLYVVRTSAPVAIACAMGAVPGWAIAGDTLLRSVGALVCAAGGGLIGLLVGIRLQSHPLESEISGAMAALRQYVSSRSG